MKFDFIGNSKRFFAISIALIIITIACTFIIRMQLDIQFRGGSMITYAYDGALDLNEFESKIDEILGAGASVQQIKDVASGLETVVVSLPGDSSMDSDAMVTLTADLNAAFPDNNLHSVQINNVDPTIGKEFLYKSIVAIAFASLLMVIFVGFRFRKIGGMSAGVMGIVALVHDVIIVFGAFIIFRFPINDNFIAVVLTILGFSLNDTIVIYDRIRENKRLLGPKVSVADLVNVSIQQSFTRSIYTTMCALVAMIVVTVVAYVNSVESILSFSLPLVFGLISGAYSTICVAGPLWVKWQEYKLKRS